MILKRMHDWRSGRTLPPAEGTPEVITAIQHQDKIGWWSFLLGRIHKDFASIQDQHYAQGSSQKKGRPWLTRLIRQVWDISFDMWEHRNKILHGDTTPQKLAQLQNLRLKAQEQFHLGTAGLLTQDHHWLEDHAAVFAMDLDSLRLWHKSITLAREAYTGSQAHTRSTLNQSTRVHAQLAFTTPTTGILVHSAASSDRQPSIASPHGVHAQNTPIVHLNNTLCLGHFYTGQGMPPTYVVCGYINKNEGPAGVLTSSS